MSRFMRIEKQMEEGDILTLNQVNDEYSYGVIFISNIMRNQENVYGFPLGTEMIEQLGSMFPRIKFYLGFHACYFQAQYYPESKQFSSAIMTGNVQGKDSVLNGLIGNADNLLDSMLGLEEKITTMMQENPLFQKVKM